MKVKTSNRSVKLLVNEPPSMSAYPPFDLLFISIFSRMPPLNKHVPLIASLLVEDNFQHLIKCPTLLAGSWSNYRFQHTQQ